MLVSFGMVPTERVALGWLTLTVSTLAFATGDFALARAHLGPPPSRLAGNALIFRYLCEAELALGEGDDERAEELLLAAGPLVRETSEAQWHGAYGSLLGELRRRQGDLDRARAAVARALDELEVCTDDVMRIARVAAVGLASEADRAVRARDLRDAAGGRDARARVRIHLDRLRAAAAAGGPVERAWAQVGAADAARARARNDPARWGEAALAWEALSRPYPAGVCRFRQAESLLERGERERAGTVAAAALATARTIGAGWLAGELDGLIARGRLDGRAGADGGSGVGGRSGTPTRAVAHAAAAAGNGESPFGLTARELQVLSLVASGATNRQIGQALYMAEKTASVHVSRILGKLGVSSRTQAAALAHRQHLA